MATGTEQRYKDLTPRDWFIQESFGKDEQCDACGAFPLEFRATVMLPESIVRSQDPIGFLLRKYGQPIIPKGKIALERYYTIRDHRSCARCAKATEQMLAHRYPDSAFVNFVRAPTNALIVLAS